MLVVQLQGAEGTRGVPYCFSNSKKDKHLSFYSFPDGKSKGKQLLRKKWLHMVSRKDFAPTNGGHRVCSKHFPGGKKTYMNNVPTLTPKAEKKSPAFTRSTVKSRNRQSLQENGVKEEANVFLNCEAEVVQEHEEMEEDINNEIIVDGEDSDSCHHKINQLEEENRKLKVENLALKAENVLFCEKLSSKPNRPTFSLDNFKEDEKIFRFYTGLPNYGTFRALFNAFGNSVKKLNYYNSGTNSEKVKDANHNKRGPKRALCPEQEFFWCLFD